MKKYCFMMSAFLLTVPLFAQKMKEKSVPNPVKIAFQKQFPGATDLEWEKEGTMYEVEFEWKKAEQSATYDATGHCIETEMEIATSDLPKAVVDYVNIHYKGKKIEEAAKITDAKGVITYEAEVKGKDLIFSNEGVFLKMVK